MYISVYPCHVYKCLLIIHTQFIKYFLNNHATHANLKYFKYCYIIHVLVVHTELKDSGYYYSLTSSNKLPYFGVVLFPEVRVPLKLSLGRFNHYAQWYTLYLVYRN